ncbi:hypothetical protein [Aeromicrobium sp. Leaf291]|uniref:hypothetical protein n=1 Tax=Aeromicrobium sp. Leaf291 TaxID=1736325 RepID=UPI0006F3D952|nr:hypothetical protein [Aeromicrobium sp. Leaf291]KQP82167.1 hypothetical protein ASF35_12035 [Aeromicrobium sp. Leaf291]
MTVPGFRDDLAALNAAILKDFPTREDPGWPGGYPEEIESALIDAVFSIRAKYGATPDVGVRRVVARWREARGVDRPDDLTFLAGQAGPSLGAVASNRSTTGGRPKVDVVDEAAGRLVEEGVVHAIDLADPERRLAAKWAYIGTKGLGPVTWSYFSMLLGHPDVKADVHVIRYAGRAARSDGSGDRFSSEYVRDLLIASTHPFDDVTELDHAIWKLQRSL